MVLSGGFGFIQCPQLLGDSLKFCVFVVGYSPSFDDLRFVVHAAGYLTLISIDGAGNGQSITSNVLLKQIRISDSNGVYDVK